MSRQQASHYRPITEAQRATLLLERRLKTLQRHWRMEPPHYKKEVDLDTRDTRTHHIARVLWPLQAGRCAYCCLSLSETPYHVDHIIPKAHNGSNHISNLALACRRCNIRKKHHTVDTFVLKLLALHYR